MRRVRRVTLYLDCPYSAWRIGEGQPLALAENVAPVEPPIEVAFTFNDGPSALADCGRRIVLKKEEGVMS